MCDHILQVCEHNILQSTWGEFHQIYYVGAVGYKNELVPFVVKRSEVKVTAKHWWSHTDIHFAGNLIFFYTTLALPGCPAAIYQMYCMSEDWL